MAAVLLALLPLLGGASRLRTAGGGRAAVGEPARLPLLPYPSSVQLGADGAEPFALQPGASVSAGDGLAEDDPALVAVRSLLEEVGGAGAQGSSALEAGGSITLRLKGEAPAGSTAEQGYQLNVTDKAVVLEAPTSEGLFYGVQTLRQLISRQEGVATLPAVTISDAPRFVWRGLHLDVSRHFFTADNVKKLLEAMSLYKLNRFHWHLTDDQGWRLPVEAYPKLTQVGAGDKAYTKQELEDVVAFAQARHIDVIPEIDVPGHVEAVLAAYPSLGNEDVKGWVAPKGPMEAWGISDYTLAPSNATWTFLETVFDTLAEVFPSKIVHMGGDEVRLGQWGESDAAKKYLALVETDPESQGKGAAGVAKLFNRKVVDLLKARGRRAAAWDEAQHTGSFPADGIVVAWNSVSEAKAAVEAGRQTVNADINVLYFDHAQASEGEPPDQGGCSSWQKVYKYDPWPQSLDADTLSEDKKNLVLGAQAQLWSEYLPTWEHAEYMAHPRSLALAERTWTPTAAIQGEAEFEGRLRQRLGDLDALGVNYRKLTTSGCIN